VVKLGGHFGGHGGLRVNQPDEDFTALRLNLMRCVHRPQMHATSAYVVECSDLRGFPYFFATLPHFDGISSIALPSCHPGALYPLPYCAVNRAKQKSFKARFITNRHLLSASLLKANATTFRPKAAQTETPTSAHR